MMPIVEDALPAAVACSDRSNETLSASACLAAPHRGCLAFASRDVLVGWICDGRATHVDILVNGETRQAHAVFADHESCDASGSRRDFVVSLERRLCIGDMVSVHSDGFDLTGSPAIVRAGRPPAAHERPLVKLHVETPQTTLTTRLSTVRGWVTFHEGVGAIEFYLDGRPQDVVFTTRPDVVDHFATPFAVGWEFCCDAAAIATSGASSARLICVMDGVRVADHVFALDLAPSASPSVPLVLLMHVPKTAGTSLGAAITEGTALATHWLYHRGRHSIPDQVASLSPQAFHDLDLVGGHFAFGLHRAIDRTCRYVAVLREPHDYLRSYFSYRKLVQCFPPFRDLDFVGALESRSDHLLDNCYTRFFTALPAERAVDDEVLALAIDNMERHFAFVGLVERMAETTVRLSRLLGVRLAIERLNVTPRCRSEGRDDRADARIAPFVRYDLELYRHAERLHWHAAA